MALSLDGMVEWHQHRSLVRDAEASLRGEITRNAQGMDQALADLQKTRESLARDVGILKTVIATGKLPADSKMEIASGIRVLENVSWKTAQSTGALSYMTYEQARKYASIYATQDLLIDSEQQAARDAIISVAPFLNTQDGDADPSPEQADAIKQKIEVLQGQLLLVGSLMQSLDSEYKAFLAAHR
ncbi:MAG: hypothetical protein JWQ90_1282 [Hydrocarboniphaga sp.]|uniref:hypothetical protein n=1 Tax=Hydrocarboniphaga sp. TaxID=2033016 RepID=UPI00261B13EA|nr:hypothetical protein [Hydrocarboniphaga sp.]MDB5968832.1 hypothetical protein [Hydrocarboniphaga sp.]